MISYVSSWTLLLKKRSNLNLYKICLLTVATVVASTRQALFHEKPLLPTPTPHNLPDISLSWGFTLEGTYHFSTGNDLMIENDEDKEYTPIPLEVMMWSDDAVKNYYAYQQILSDVSERLKNKTHFFSPLQPPSEGEIKSLTGLENFVQYCSKTG